VGVVSERRAPSAARRRRFRRVDGARGGAVQVEAFDACLAARALDGGRHLGLHKLLADRLGHFLEGRGRGGAAFLDLDDVPAEGGAHRVLADLAGLQGEGGGGEFRHHVATAEEAEVTALARPRAGRTALRDGCEVGAAAHLGEGGAGLGLGRHQDVAGAHLLLGRAAGDLAVVAGAHGGVVDARGNLLGQPGLLELLFLGAADAGAHLGILVQAGAAGGGGHRAPGDHLVEQQGQHDLRRRAAHFLGQVAQRGSQVGQEDGLAIDARHHRVGRRGGGRSRGRGRLGQDAGGNAERQGQGKARAKRMGEARAKGHAFSGPGKTGRWPMRPAPTRRPRARRR
jgi:hypothetical protein